MDVLDWSKLRESGFSLFTDFDIIKIGEFWKEVNDGHALSRAKTIGAKWKCLRRASSASTGTRPRCRLTWVSKRFNLWVTTTEPTIAGIQPEKRKGHGVSPLPSRQIIAMCHTAKLKRVKLINCTCHKGELHSTERPWIWRNAWLSWEKNIHNATLM